MTLNFEAGSSAKVAQLIGDCDWPVWDATGTCAPTASATASRYDVLGTDLGAVFEDGDRMIFLFGDTIGRTAAYFPTYTSEIDPFLFQAHDTIAGSRSRHPEKLRLDFIRGGDGRALLIEPQYPDGTFLPMGADDTPNAGISVGGRLYIVCNSGADLTNTSDPHADAYSVLVRFDKATRTFAAGRTISQTAAGGHFVFTALQSAPTVDGFTGTTVLMFGEGHYRQSDIYLAAIPQRGFENGRGTRYFAGMRSGNPIWVGDETQAVPVVHDNPLGTQSYQPTVGNISVTWSPTLALWLMTYDGGRQSPATAGVYFTYASAPWGPWAQPQLIFNARRDGGAGVFIYAPSQNPPGPAGPTIDPAKNVPDLTSGGVYAPFLLGPFVRVSGGRLTIYYTMSTWNPYTVVEMRSDFALTR